RAQGRLLHLHRVRVVDHEEEIDVAVGLGGDVLALDRARARRDRVDRAIGTGHAHDRREAGDGQPAPTMRRHDGSFSAWVARPTRIRHAIASWVSLSSMSERAERHLPSHVFNVIVFAVAAAFLIWMMRRLGWQAAAEVLRDAGSWFPIVIGLDLI